MARLLARSLALLLACGPGCDPASDVVRGDADAPVPAASPPPAPATDAITVTEVAYAAGRRWGDACVFAMVDDTKKAQLAYEQAVVGARRVGLEPPPRPSKADALQLLVDVEAPAAITTVDREITVAYLLGATVTQVLVGGTLGAELGKALDSIEIVARRVPVPEAEWKRAVDGLRTAGSKANTEAMTQRFDAYFRYDATPKGAAWASTDAPAPARAPFAFTSAAGRYAVTFPYEPTERTDTQGGVTWHVAETSIEVFSVSWADHGDEAKARAALASWADNLPIEGLVVHESTIAGHPGRAIAMKIGDSTMRVHAVVIGERFYKVVAGTKGDAAKADRFLASFAPVG